MSRLQCFIASRMRLSRSIRTPFQEASGARSKRTCSSGIRQDLTGGVAVGSRRRMRRLRGRHCFRWWTRRLRGCRELGHSVSEVAAKLPSCDPISKALTRASRVSNFADTWGAAIACCFGTWMQSERCIRSEAQGWGKTRQERERKKQEMQAGKPFDDRLVVDEQGTVRSAEEYVEAGLARYDAVLGYGVPRAKRQVAESGRFHLAGLPLGGSSLTRRSGRRKSVNGRSETRGAGLENAGAAWGVVGTFGDIPVTPVGKGEERQIYKTECARGEVGHDVVGNVDQPGAQPARQRKNEPVSQGQSRSRSESRQRGDHRARQNAQRYSAQL